MAKGLKGLGDAKDLLGKVKQMQDDLARAQEDLANETVEASAGGGAVAVTMTGTQECTRISIAPELLKEEDLSLIEDLILLALNQALQDSRMLAARKLGSFTDDLNLPGGMG
jgi:DNA-binding YbaB/EbfC family protein